VKSTLDARSFTRAACAPGGLANFVSIAIQTGGIGTLAGSRPMNLSWLGLGGMPGRPAGGGGGRSAVSTAKKPLPWQSTCLI
jgi:hypothetical protein